MTTEIVIFRVHPFTSAGLPSVLASLHLVSVFEHALPLRPLVRLPLRVPLLRPSSFAFISSLFRPLPLPSPVLSLCLSPSPMRCLSPFVLLSIAFQSPIHFYRAFSFTDSARHLLRCLGHCFLCMSCSVVEAVLGV
jgi:hypothetical protein